MMPLQRASPGGTEEPARFLYAILRQLDTRSVDWDKVGRDIDSPTNGHAQRMRYARLRDHMEGGKTSNRSTPKPTARGTRRKGKMARKQTKRSGVSDPLAKGKKYDDQSGKAESPSKALSDPVDRSEVFIKAEDEAVEDEDAYIKCEDMDDDYEDAEAQDDVPQAEDNFDLGNLQEDYEAVTRDVDAQFGDLVEAAQAEYEISVTLGEVPESFS